MERPRSKNGANAQTSWFERLRHCQPKLNRARCPVFSVIFLPQNVKWMNDDEVANKGRADFILLCCYRLFGVHGQTKSLMTRTFLTGCFISQLLLESPFCEACSWQRVYLRNKYVADRVKRLFGVFLTVTMCLSFTFGTFQN